MKTDYIAEAHVTLSPSFHGAKVSKEHFAAVISDAIDALAALDSIKKALFYGRQDVSEYNARAKYEEFAMQNCAELDISSLSAEGDAFSGINMLHAIVGIATEAGELLEAMREALFGSQEIDSINIAEEIGDIFWYQAIALRCIGSTFEAEQRRNINKLRWRFPEKFTEFDANNRNLLSERDVLERDFSVDTSKSVF